MKTRKRILLGIGIVALSMVLTTCKPIDYYLQMIYKAYGKVTDTNGNPLESVEVFIKGYQYSELTNGEGDYEIELAEGTWTLEFVKEGYMTKSSLPFQVGRSPLVRRWEENASLEPIPLSIWGTWVNPIYKTGPNGPPGKVEFNANGTTAWYALSGGLSPYDSGMYRIDSQIASLYQIYFAGVSSPSGEYFLLIQVGSDGTTLEGNVAFTEYPAIIDPTNIQQYFTFSKQ